MTLTYNKRPIHIMSTPPAPSAPSTLDEIAPNEPKTPSLSSLGIPEHALISVNLKIKGGRLQGQIFQKSLMYFRPRGFMGMKNEKVHCLMMTKLINTKQIHLLTLVKYFYARMALFHYHPSSVTPDTWARIRAADVQRRPFLYPINKR